LPKESIFRLKKRKWLYWNETFLNSQMSDSDIHQGLCGIAHEEGGSCLTLKGLYAWNNNGYVTFPCTSWLVYVKLLHSFNGYATFECS